MKFFTKEVKIGLTAVVAIVVVYLLLNFMKGINVFKASNTYYVAFANIEGLSVSSSVYANGYPVGIVRTISYDYAGQKRVIVGIELDKAMRVPKGTRAELESSLMGGVTMHLVLGPNPAANLAVGDTLQGGPHQGALAQMEAVIPTVVSMAPKIDSIVSNLAALTGDPALRTVLANAAGISQELRATSARLNGLMRDDVPGLVRKVDGIADNLSAMTASLNQTAGNLEDVDLQATVARVDSTLNEARRLAAELGTMSKDINEKLNATDNSLGLLLNDRGLYDRLDGTVRNLDHAVQSGDSLLTDLKAHPKRYVHFSVFGKKEK